MNYDEPHLFSISQLLHEACVLLHPRDVKRLYLGTDSEDEIVVRNSGGRNLSLDFGQISDCYCFVCGLCHINKER